MTNILYPPWHLKTTPLYHITHTSNLDAILENGCLLAKNLVGAYHESIAHIDIQEKRSKKEVHYPPYGSLHEYVPFYFAPRSPMLLKNNTDSQPDRKNQLGCLLNAKPQEEIIYFVTNAELIHENKLPYVFYDMHPLKAVAKCYNNINDLDKVKWKIFYEIPLIGSYSKHWQNKDDPEHPHWLNRKDLRQAEFLIHKNVDLQHIEIIATMTESTRDLVLSKLDQFQIKMSVKIEKDWYY